MSMWAMLLALVVTVALGVGWGVLVAFVFAIPWPWAFPVSIVGGLFIGVLAPRVVYALVDPWE